MKLSLIHIYPENPDTPDNIPDKYQTEVTFRAVNGSVSFEKTYVTLYDEKGEYSENGTGRLAANQIPATTANNGYHFVNWTPDTPNEDMIISREGAAFTANHAINTSVSYTHLKRLRKKAIQQLPGQPSKKPCSRRKLY